MKRKEEERKSSLPQGWRFVLAGVVAMAAGPLLAEIAGGGELMFAALSFGAALGAIDSLGVEDGMEVAARGAVGLALGGLLGVALVVFASPGLAALTLGGGVILSRWIWVLDRPWTALVSVASVAVIAMGVRVLFHVVDPWTSQGVLVQLHPVYWGIFSGIGAALFAEAPETIEKRKLLEDKEERGS